MLTNYREVDNSKDTLPQLYYVRGVTPLGAEVHTTSGLNSLSYLQGGSVAAGRPASIDFLIDRTGKRHRIVPRGHGSYHAGIGSYTELDGAGSVIRTIKDDDVSRRFVGYELECLDNQVPTLQQLDSLAESIVLEGLSYGWRWPYNIIGHYATARPLGRRSDPVNFNWGQFLGRLYVWAAAYKIPGLIE